MALAGKTPLLLLLRCFCASYAAELLTQQLFWPAFPSPSEGRWLRNWFKDQKQERPVCATLKLMVKWAALNRYKYIWSWVGVSTRLFVLFTELFAEVSRVVGHCADRWLPLPLAAPVQPSGFHLFFAWQMCLLGVQYYWWAQPWLQGLWVLSLAPVSAGFEVSPGVALFPVLF